MVGLFSKFNPLVLLFLASVFLTGCKTTPIKNGEIISDISGKASQVKWFSVTIPAYTGSLMVQASGSPNLTVALHDSDKNSIAASCPSAAMCLLNYPAPGKYLVSIKGSEDFSGAYLSAAWGGHNLGTLVNNVEKTELAGGANAAHLQSLYLPVDTLKFKLQSSGASGVTLELLDEDGSQVKLCTSPTHCLIDQLTAGTYFLRISKSEAYENLAIKAVWGGAGAATMQNGVMKTGLSGAQGSQHLESFYIPQTTEAVLIQGSAAGNYAIDILDEQGGLPAECSGNRCFIEAPVAGLYYVRVSFHDDTQDMGLVAIWGGEQESTLRNGSYSTLAGVAGGFQLGTLYIQQPYVDSPQDNWDIETYLRLSTGLASGSISLFDQHGHIVADNGSYCLHDCTYALQPGIYFVQFWFDEDTTNGRLAAAWGNRHESTLTNGGVLPMSGNRQQAALQTLFIENHSPDSAEDSWDIDTYLRLSVGLTAGVISLFDEQGQEVSSSGSHCYQDCMFTLEPGVYFVQFLFDEATSNGRLSAAWGNRHESTLTNGGVSPISGSQQQVALQALFIENHIPDTVQDGWDLVTYLRLSAGLTEGSFSLFDQQGRSVSASGNSSYCQNDCTYTLEPGVYFVQFWFDQATTNGRLSAAWGNRYESTLMNGGVSPIAGKQQQVALQALFIENHQPDTVQDGWDLATYLRLSVGLTEGSFSLFDQQGRSVSASGNGSYCQHDCTYTLEPGVYFVQFWFDADTTNGRLSAAWGNRHESTLMNGGVSPIAGNQQQVALHALFIENHQPDTAQDGWDLVTYLKLSAGLTEGSFSLFDQQGRSVSPSSNGWYCRHDCTYTLEPGVYFVQFWFYEDTANGRLSAAWGNRHESTLMNGGVSPIAGSQQQVALQVLFIENHQPDIVQDGWDLVTNLRLSAGLTEGSFSLFDQHGQAVSGTPSYCQHDCMYTLEPGVYFVQFWFDEHTANGQLSAAWGNRHESTLESGVQSDAVNLLAGSTSLHTLFLPGIENDLQVSLSQTSGLRLNVRNEQGDIPNGCNAGACDLADLPMGVYFVETHAAEDITGLQLTASWQDGGAITSPTQ